MLRAQKAQVRLAAIMCDDDGDYTHMYASMRALHSN